MYCACILCLHLHSSLYVGNAKAAKRAVLVGMVFTSAWVLLIVALTLAFKGLLPKLFTSDPCLLEALAVPMFVIPWFVGFDSVQGTLGGVVRASGKQLYGSFINFFTYWVFGLPLGAVLTIIAGLGATGYWIGLTCAPFLQSVLYAVMLLSMNWRKESEKAQRMAGKEVEQTDRSEMIRFHVEGKGKANTGSSSDNTYCGEAVANGLLSSVSVEENEARCKDGDNLVEEDDDAMPLLPNISAEAPQAGSSSVNVANGEKSPSSMPNHCVHLHGVRGSDFNDAKCDDDLLPLMSEEEEGEPSWGHSEGESGTDIETEAEATNGPTFTTTSVPVLRLQTVILRVATLLATIFLLAVAVTVSQLYQSDMGLCLNSTIAHNLTVNITNSQPACPVY